MSKVIKNSSDMNKLEAVVEDLIFLPSPPHRKAKTKFWSRYSDLDVTGGDVSLSQALQLVKDPQLSRWWHLPGFKDWFLNKDEARERLEYLWYLGMDAMEAIFLDPDANHNAKVQAFKNIAQLAGKEPDKNREYADADIQKMDVAKLKAYIEKNAPKALLSGEKKADDDDSEGES